jgi:hypothetical protein
VDTKYIDEHYQMLLSVAAAALDAVQREPIAVHHEMIPDFLLDSCIQSTLQMSSTLVARRSLDMTSTSGRFPPSVRDGAEAGQETTCCSNGARATARKSGRGMKDGLVQVSASAFGACGGC